MDWLVLLHPSLHGIKEGTLSEESENLGLDSAALLPEVRDLEQVT